MSKKRVILLLVCVLASSAGHLSATALTLFPIGAKAGTMAGAFVGRASNATAIFYNPAGLAFQKGVGFRFNVGYYDYRIEARSIEPQRTDLTTEPQLKGSVFVSYTYKERISIGVGYDGPARSVADQSFIGNLTFDAFLQYVMLGERTSSYPGYPLTFGGHYWVFGFGVGLYL